MGVGTGRKGGPHNKKGVELGVKPRHLSARFCTTLHPWELGVSVCVCRQLDQ